MIKNICQHIEKQTGSLYLNELQGMKYVRLPTVHLQSIQASVGLDRKLERHITGLEVLISVSPKVTKSVIPATKKSVSAIRTSILFMESMLQVLE